MRLKHILFSGLFLSTTFVACTNEDFEDLGAQDLTGKAISLGENFTISGGFAGAETRAIYGESVSGGVVEVKSLWEPEDQVGGAWYAALTSKQNGNTAAKGFLFEGNSFASNHPYSRKDKTGNVANAEFETNTNSFAGKYVLYFPYNPDVAKASATIPVSVEMAQTMDVANPLAHVSKKENFFAYTNAEYVDGGSQVKDFKLNAVPVLYRVAFKASEATKTLVGKDISMVILESDADNFYAEGDIKVGLAASGANNYVKALPVYVADDAKATNIITLTVTGNEGNSDYQVTAVGDNGGMKKPFYIAALPAKAEISTLVFKVVTTDGKVFQKTLGNLDTDDNKAIRDAITNEGGFFNYNITLTELGAADEKVYTKQQFENAWAKAVAGEIDEIELGAPLTLETLTLEETGSIVRITGDKTLTVGELTVSDGSLVIENLEAGNVTVGLYGALETTESTEITGATTVKGGVLTLDGVASMGSLDAQRRSSIDITGADDEEGTIEGTFSAAVQSTVVLKDIILNGTSSIATGDVENNKYGVTATGTVTFAGVVSVAEGALVKGSNNASLFFNGKLTNEGTVDNSNIGAIAFHNLANKGTIRLKKAAATANFTGNTVNTGVIEVTDGTVTNKGTFTNRGELKIADQKTLTNGYVHNGSNVACTLTLDATGSELTSAGTITNAAASTVVVKSADVAEDDTTTPATPAAPANVRVVNNGTLNVELASASKETTFAKLDNNNTVNINKGIVKIASNAMAEGDNANAEIIVTASGVLNFGNEAYTNAIGGLIIAEKANTVTNKNAGDVIARYYGNTNADATTVIINNAVTLSTTAIEALGGKDLIMRANVTLQGDMSLDGSENSKVKSLKVDGEVSLKANLSNGDQPAAQSRVLDIKNEELSVNQNSILKVETGVKVTTKEGYNTPEGVVKLGGTIEVRQ